MIEIASTVLLFIAFCAFAFKRSLTYMHIYQQEEYDTLRFLPWILRNMVFDKRLSAVVLLMALFAPYMSVFLLNFILFTAMALVAYVEKDPRKAGKKNLVMTARVMRILTPALLLNIAFALWVFVPALNMPWLWVANIHFIPVSLMLMNAALAPIEAANQQKYWNEAHEKVLELKPVVIGITGSFGKTSVKHILGHILKKQAPTLVTPGSVNTPMGISRIVREQLEPNHKFFVVEMGAYGRGSIERLCRLTPPDYGIITAVGHAHYERFKSLDAVAETKYELAEAVLNKGGDMVVHEKTLRFAKARAIKESQEAHFIVCGESMPSVYAKGVDKSYLKKGDLEIFDILQTNKGIEVRFSWKKVSYNVEAPLFGVHHGHNIAQAFACAILLGFSSADIQTALLSVPQIEHRLEVRKQSGGVTIIDDAYNSNPLGFKAALELLAQLGKNGRKILITPGMVELGGIHDSAHATIGEMAGSLCNIVIVVQGDRIPTFIDGFKRSAGDKECLRVKTFAEAQKWVVANRQEGDFILLANDLPDLYERMPKI